VSPFIVLHVCMGNICRSPMAERLLAHAVRERGGEDLVLSESVGTGSWHAGERMNAPAEAELRRRGVDPDGFRARQLLASHIDTADLVLTATSEQLDFVEGLRPDALSRVFVLGEFGRLTDGIDLSALPAPGLTAEAVQARGRALVRAVDAARGDDRSRSADDLGDPWGKSSAFFTGTADRIATSLASLVDALLPR
jgi:protein-tyrosine phosphatase